MAFLKAQLSAILVCYAFSFSLQANENQVGEKLYKDNCAACHRLNSFTAGPSLVEISKKYTKDKQQAFLAWTNSPGKINPKTIQMPAMAHLGNKALLQIHQYILSATKNIKEAKNRHGFMAYQAPPPIYPYMKRTYMPFASPAAIAVVLHERLGLSWDASLKRIRYAFPNTQTFFKGESAMEEEKTKILYRENSPQFWSVASDTSIEYLGYKLHKGLPEFLYKASNMFISERHSLADNNAFVRTYRVTGAKKNIVIDLSHEGNATITATAGTFDENKLTLIPDELKHFSITVTLHD